jgi:hypothetical protein
VLPDAAFEARGGGSNGGGEKDDVGIIEEETGERSSITLSERTVLLDPQSNSPLKTFMISALDLERLGSSEASQDTSRQWLPPLRLTQREREINLTKGAILILGRSGTGKSTSIVARVVSDHEAAINRGSPFIQLFVTRMKRPRGTCSSTCTRMQHRQSRSTFFN